MNAMQDIKNYLYITFFLPDSILLSEVGEINKLMIEEVMTNLFMILNSYPIMSSLENVHNNSNFKAYKNLMFHPWNL